MANSRARSVDDTEGLVKFIADAKTDKILGVHIMGPNAGRSMQVGGGAGITCAGRRRNGVMHAYGQLQPTIIKSSVSSVQGN